MASWRIRLACMLLGSAIALGACDGRQQQPAPTSRPAQATPSDLAREVVARRLEIPAEAVTVVSIEAREFADSSLGCPEPGMVYQQVITPGHQAVVEAEGRRFDVRVAGAGAKICHRRKGNSDRGRRNSELPVADLAELARADLAARLMTDDGAVSISGVRALRAQETLPGCAPQCEPNAAVCAYAISLLHDGRRYDYLASAGKVTPCPPILPS